MKTRAKKKPYWKLNGETLLLIDTCGWIRAIVYKENTVWRSVGLLGTSDRVEEDCKIKKRDIKAALIFKLGVYEERRRIQTDGY